MAHCNRTVFCNSRKQGLKTVSVIYRFLSHDSPSFEFFHSMENCVHTLASVLIGPHDAGNVTVIGGVRKSFSDTMHLILLEKVHGLY